MSKWLITTEQPIVKGKIEEFKTMSQVHTFEGNTPTEDEIKKVINVRGAIIFMQKLADEE